MNDQPQLLQQAADLFIEEGLGKEQVASQLLALGFPAADIQAYLSEKVDDTLREAELNTELNYFDLADSSGQGNLSSPVSVADDDPMLNFNVDEAQEVIDNNELAQDSVMASSSESLEEDDDDTEMVDVASTKELTGTGDNERQDENPNEHEEVDSGSGEVEPIVEISELTNTFNKDASVQQQVSGNDNVAEIDVDSVVLETIGLDDGYVVIWQSTESEFVENPYAWNGGGSWQSTGNDIFMQAYNSKGELVGEQVQLGSDGETWGVNTVELEDGGTALTYLTVSDSGESTLYNQIINNDGRVEAAAEVVGHSGRMNYGVVELEDGGHFISYTLYNEDGSSSSVGQTYNAAGDAVGDPVTHQNSAYSFMSAVAQEGGGVMVYTTSLNNEDWQYDVEGNFYSNTGEPYGDAIALTEGNAFVQEVFHLDSGGVAIVTANQVVLYDQQGNLMGSAIELQGEGMASTDIIELDDGSVVVATTFTQSNFGGEETHATQISVYDQQSQTTVTIELPSNTVENSDGNPEIANVVANDDGSFTVLWVETSEGHSSSTLLAQTFTLDANGDVSAVGEPQAISHVDDGSLVFQQNSGMAILMADVEVEGVQGYASNAIQLENGNFVMTWMEAGESNQFSGVILNNGEVVGQTLDFSQDPTIDATKTHQSTMLYDTGAGEFMAVWSNGYFVEGDDGSAWQYDLTMQQYAADGTGQGESVLAQSDSPILFDQFDLNNGDSLLTWTTQQGDENTLHALQFDSDGNVVGEPFELASADGQFANVSITELDNGGLAITWNAQVQGDDGEVDYVDSSVFTKVYQPNEQGYQIEGTDGDDQLSGGDGADVINANGGDDDIDYDAADTIDGGAGFDTVALQEIGVSGEPVSLAFENLDNIEAIQLQGDSHISIDLADVIDVTDADNTLIVFLDDEGQSSVDVSGGELIEQTIQEIDGVSYSFDVYQSDLGTLLMETAPIEQAM